MDVVPSLSVSDQRDLVAIWFEEYHTRLFHYLLRLLGDTESAADALQDTFLRALIALDKQEPPSNPSAWLYRIATNTAYSSLRRRNRFRWLPFHDSEQTSDFEGDLAQSQIVQRCLAKLRPADAEVLLLHEHVGLTSYEIAALTGEKATTIRVRLSRACKRFSEIYAKENAA